MWIGEDRKGFDRDVYAEFKDWQVIYPNKALIVQGVRGAGVTYAVKQYCYRNFNNVYYTSFLGDMPFRKLLHTMLLDYEPCSAHTIIDFFNERGFYMTDSPDSVVIIDDLFYDTYICKRVERLLCGKFRLVVINTHFYVADKGSAEAIPCAFASNFYKITVYPMSLQEVIRAIPQKPVTEVYQLYKEYGGYPNVVKWYAKEVVSKNLINLCFPNFQEAFCTDSLCIAISDRYGAIKSAYNCVLPLILKRKDFNVTELKNILYTISDEEFFPGVITEKCIKYVIVLLQKWGILVACPDSGVPGDIKRVRFYFNDNGVLYCFLSQYFGFDSTVKRYIIKNFIFAELMKKGFDIHYIKNNQYDLDFVFRGNDQRVYGLTIKKIKGTHAMLKKCEKEGVIDKGYIVSEEEGENTILLQELANFNF